MSWTNAPCHHAVRPVLPAPDPVSSSSTGATAGAAGSGTSLAVGIIRLCTQRNQKASKTCQKSKAIKISKSKNHLPTSPFLLEATYRSIWNWPHVTGYILVNYIPKCWNPMICPFPSWPQKSSSLADSISLRENGVGRFSLRSLDNWSDEIKKYLCQLPKHSVIPTVIINICIYR